MKNTHFNKHFGKYLAISLACLGLAVFSNFAEAGGKDCYGKACQPPPPPKTPPTAPQSGTTNNTTTTVTVTPTTNSQATATAGGGNGGTGIGKGGQGGTGGQGGAGGLGGQGGTGTGGSVGDTTSIAQQKQNSDQANQQITQNQYPQQTPPTVLPPIIVAGCGIGMAGGGGTPRGTGALGLEFTTAECYSYQDAAALMAVGDYQSACEVLHQNNATQRAKKRGARIADCALLQQKVVYHDVEKIVYLNTDDQVQERIDAAVRIDRDKHAEPQCSITPKSVGPIAKKKRKAAVTDGCHMVSKLK